MTDLAGSPTITRDIRLRVAMILATASVVAEAKAASLAPTTTHGAPESSAPINQGVALYDELLTRWQACFDDKDAYRFLAYAHVAVERVKHGPRHHDESNATLTKRILADYIGVAANEVAVWEQCTTATIRRIRTDNGRHPSSGDPTGIVVAKWSSIGERREIEAELAAQGLSTREIAWRVGVDHSVVCRDLKRFA